MDYYNNFYKKNKLYIFFSFSITIIFFSYYLMFYIKNNVELPYLSWIDQFKAIGYKMFDSNLKFKDFFTHYGEHGLLGNNILFYFNIKWFGMTTLYDTFINAFFILVVAIIIDIFIVNKMNDNIFKFILTILLINFILFERLQLSSGAMETQVRIGLNLGIFYLFYIDHFIKKDVLNKKDYIVLILLGFLTINVFGTMYSFAIVPVIICFFLYDLIINKKLNKKILLIIGLLFIFSIFYFLEYDLISFMKNSHSSDAASSGIIGNAFYLLKNFGNTFKGYLAYSGIPLVGYSAISDNKISDTTLLMVGAIVFILMVFSIFVFFFKKNYIISNFPIFIILYSIFTIFIVMIGRPFDWPWYYSEWYIVHSRFQLIGIFLIISMNSSIKQLFSKITFIIFGISNISIIIFLIFTENMYVDRYYYVVQYYKEKQEYLLISNTDYIPLNDEGNTPILTDLDTTIEYVDYLKKYNLSIYRYSNITNNYYDTSLKAGYYEKEEQTDLSFWLKKYSISYFNSNDESISFGLYTPKVYENNYVTIKINNEIVYHEYLIEYQHLTFNLKANELNCIEIAVDKIIDSGLDTRELGVMIIPDKK